MKSFDFGQINVILRRPKITRSIIVSFISHCGQNLFYHICDGMNIHKSQHVPAFLGIHVGTCGFDSRTYSLRWELYVTILGLLSARSAGIFWTSPGSVGWVGMTSPWRCFKHCIPMTSKFDPNKSYNSGNLRNFLTEASLEVKLPTYGQMQQQWWEQSGKRKSQ